MKEHYQPAEAVTASQVLDTSRALIGEHWRYLGLVGAAIIVGYSLFDWSGNTSIALLAQIVVFTFVQYKVTERLLADRLPGGIGSARYRSMFGSGLLSGLGTMFGLVFFLLPGVFLMARWSIAAPLVVAENQSSVRALGESWERTRKSSGPLFLVFLLIGAAYFVTFVMGVGMGSWSNFGIDLTRSVIANLVSVAMSLFGWVLAVAVYRCLAPDQGGLQDVFA